MSGRDFAFLSGEPTHLYESPQKRLSEEDTYRGPNPHTMGQALGRLMWALDGLRCASVRRLGAYREEDPELRRIDGVLIWLVSSVLTAVSLLVGLHLLG